MKEKITRVYVDMDGVLCDFVSAYKDMFGDNVFDEVVDEELRKEHWDKFVKSHAFSNLPEILNVRKFFDGIIDIVPNADICILSSLGRPQTMFEVQRDKSLWLVRHAHGCNIKHYFFVPRRQAKQYYAYNGAILIDDHKENCEQFVEQGGLAIVHTNSKSTLEELAKIAGN